ncbi:MAG: hypothetical protein AAFX55_09210 [Bacteroidota bacterium]
MKPLIILISSFIIALFVTYFFKKAFDFMLSARIALSMMLCFTAIGHFVYTNGMSLMMPEFIPFRISLVYLTGLLEIVFAMALLIPKFQVITGWAILIFLILVLPANIYASINTINYQKGTFDGPGLSYLWFRIPLQMLFIIWTYISTIRVY